MRISSSSETVELLTELDLSSPQFYGTGDPHPMWTHLRERCPVHWQEPRAGKPGFWVVTRYADVSRVLAGHRHFSAARGNILTTLGRADIAGGKMLAVTDPPRHTRLKAPLAPHLSRAAVRAYEPRLRELAQRVLAPGVRRGHWDFAERVSRYPIAIAGLLLGIAESDWERLKHYTYAAIAESDPRYRDAGTSAESVLGRAHSEIFLQLTREVTRPARAEADDLIGAFLRSAADGAMTREEVLLNAYSLLIGATVTTSHVASAGLLALLEQPAEYARWQAGGNTATAVEEMLRWSSPANHAMRHTTGDVRLGEATVGAGDPVTAWLGSANRDAAVFAEPFRFAVSRHPNRHIAFGVGAHRCVGAHLARLALTVLFEEFAARVARVELAGEPRHLHSTFIAGVTHLPIRTVARPGVLAATVGEDVW
ncbi:cytochrome P450 [Streptomyces sp. XM4011]|uniref:cytochrome P450 n=1 Tax=Streptomyces TaxID=1883 RepID=UPI001FF9566A|nr:cytochrome P450 [Streptomyces sp. XM4011]MCK1813218.1 cytochrome P450 [Streptomyces sp. XM4011]